MSSIQQTIPTSAFNDQQLIKLAWPNASTWKECWRHRSVSVLVDRNDRSEHFCKERCLLHAKKSVKLIKQIAKEVSSYQFDKNECPLHTETSCLNSLHTRLVRGIIIGYVCSTPKTEDLNRLVAINARPEILKAFVDNGAKPTDETIGISLMRMVDVETIRFLMKHWDFDKPKQWLVFALKYHPKAFDLFTRQDALNYSEYRYPLICVRIIHQVNADFQKLPDSYSSKDLRRAWDRMYRKAFIEEYDRFERAGLMPLQLHEGPGSSYSPAPSNTIDYWQRRIAIGSFDEYMKFKFSSFADNYKNVSQQEYEKYRTQFLKYETIFEDIEKMEKKIAKDYIQPADAFLLHRNEGESSSSVAVEAESEESCLTCIVRLFSSCLRGGAHLD